MGRKKSAAKKAALLDEDETVNTTLDFHFDKEFEKRFVHNQQRKELHQLQEKYGADAVSEDESEDESEDDDAEGIDSISRILLLISLCSHKAIVIF